MISTQKDTKDPDTSARVSSEVYGMNSNATRLEQLGLHAELEPTFSLTALICLSLCIMATWEAVASVVAQALASGGVPCLVYNYNDASNTMMRESIATFICTVATTASLAEIASIYPTAGGVLSSCLADWELGLLLTRVVGQYHWVTALFPGRGKKIMSWLTGWISIGGQIVFTASAAFAGGLMIQGLIILNDADYAPQRWHGLFLYWAVLVYALVMNTLGYRRLSSANLIAGFVVILVTLGVKSEKNTAASVFTEFSNVTGWQSDGIAWLIGLTSTVFPFLGYDAACHLAEELPNASRNVPLAMMGSVAMNGVMGLGFVFMLAFSTGSLEDILQTPTGFPFMVIFLEATKSTALTTVLALFIVIIAVAAAMAGLTSTSRTFWAFARDDAVPFSNYFGKVSSKQKVPVRAVVLVCILNMLLGTIYAGNTTAFNAVLSMAIFGMYLSYMLPIIAMLFFGRSRLRSCDYGPFKLPRWLGVSCNTIALAWSSVAICFSTFPTQIPVTEANMNYSSVIMIGWVIIGLVFYLFNGRYRFKMPVVTTDLQ
ncbi:unnamed protein product [Clonostachys rhizophaga]|uniref:Choline transport protein n=1 Tax=Clonostachys rhizophaga TaxID=160324 RepID=A0A9N9VBP2_9HYPO|nr:unnamed protein product [Clonostachys rhizophaga]